VKFIGILETSHITQIEEAMKVHLALL